MPNFTWDEGVSEASRYQWDGGKVFSLDCRRVCGSAVIFTQRWWFSASAIECAAEPTLNDSPNRSADIIAHSLKGEIAMQELASVVSTTLADYYEKVRESIHTWIAPLTTEQLWRNPYSYGNSIGHLLLHLTGNLNYYIGAQIAGNGYVRNRPLEFNDASKRPKEQVLADFDAAISMVASTVRAQSPQDWVAPYSAVLEPEAHDRFTVFMRMAAHANHHAGQIIYLSKELTKSVS
jgi:uncharacterized damage-inducible protein DinB